MTMWRLSCTQSRYSSRPPSDPPHPRFHCHPTWYYHLFKIRSRPNVPSNPSRTSRYSQDCSHDSIWFVPISLYAVWVEKRSTNLSTLHGPTSPRLDLLLCLHRRLAGHHGILINHAKCEYGVTELDFLGNRVNSQGIRPLSDKVQAIREFPQPASLYKLREFLGLINFYLCFLSGCMGTLQPLNISSQRRKGT